MTNASNYVASGKGTEPRIPLAAIVIYVVAMAVNGFDGTVINPALPAIAADLGILASDLGSIEWAFLVASAVALPTAGWVGSRLGTRRTFVACLAAFSAGLAIAAVAPNLGLLVFGRVVQGLGSGVLVPVGLAMMYRGATGEQRLRVARITLIPLTVAPMLGPVAGGFITHHWGWRWIFGAMFPVAALTGLAALVLLTPRRLGHSLGEARGEQRGLDVVGLVLGCLSCGGLATGGPLLVSGLNPGGVIHPWTATAGVVLTGLSILGGVAAVRRTRAARHPAFDLGVFGFRPYRCAGAVVAAASAGLSGFLFVVPLVLADRGVSAERIGLMMFPETVGLLLGGQLMMRFKSWFGTRATVVSGAVLAGVAVMLVLTFSPLAAGWGTAALMVCFGVCLSQTVLLTQGAAFWGISEERTDDATALFMVQRTLAGAWGVVVVAAVLGWAETVWPSGAGTAAGLGVVVLLLACVPLARWLRAEEWEEATGPQREPGTQ